MGASFSNLSPDKKKGLTILMIIISFIIIIVIVLGILSGTGILSDETTSQPTVSPIDVALGSLASFSPTDDSQIWTKVFDSMMSNKCFLNFNDVPQVNVTNLKKIVKYQVDNNMLSVDNPFKNSIDVPVIGCSDDGTRLVLTLDLSVYGEINPFKQGDNVYIFGIKGETEANTEIGSDQKITKPRYVYATNKEFSNLQNQIMISDVNPCDYMGKCDLDKSLPLFSSGTYTSGGTVRLTGNFETADSFISQRPLMMFYLYMAYKNYSFTWPYTPMSVSQIYDLYSSHYNGFIQWYGNLPQTCTQPEFVDNSTNGFVSGSVTVSGGSGTGMKMYIISMNLLGYKIGYLIVTDDGTGYTDEDIITISQDSVSATTKISINASCSLSSGINLSGPVFLSYKTTLQQLKNLINYAVTIDPEINTIVMYSSSAISVPDNYNNPDISLLFLKTTPDTSNMSGSEYSGNLTSMTKVCDCDGMKDQGSLQRFFPLKINKCANQIIFTSNTKKTPFDFINNAAAAIGSSCNVTMC